MPRPTSALAPCLSMFALLCAADSWAGEVPADVAVPHRTSAVGIVLVAALVPTMTAGWWMEFGALVGGDFSNATTGAAVLSTGAVAGAVGVPMITGAVW
jgi:hypothetical protein